MNDIKNSYQQIMKATTIYGSVQVFNIIFSVIRSKIIAIIIGPNGIGIISLLTTTLNLVNGFTSFGLEKSAVKDIAFSNNSSELQNVSKTVSVFKKLVWITALVGALLMILTAPLLSELAFNNRDYSWSIVFISIALIFKQLTNTNLAILQGLRKLKYLAKVNLISNFFITLISLPLYYFFKIEAIVPAIIITAVLSFIVSFYYSKKVKIKPIQISFKDAFYQGKEMTQLGFSLSISTMLGLLGMYLLQIFISTKGGVNQIGLYMAGYVILNTYVGLVFNAMSTDYYPKLAALNNDKEKIKFALYQQSYMALLILLPIIVVFLAITPFIVSTLYSDDFLPVVLMIKWGILGMILKAVSFSMGYIIIAKGDSKVFVKTAILFNILLLGCNVLGYHLGGLEGLGISFVIYYFIHLIVITLIIFIRYNIYLSISFFILFLLAAGLCVAAFLVTYMSEGLLKTSFFLILISVSLLVSYYKINKKINIKTFLLSLLNRKSE